jgi:hypothetical protein
MLGCKRLLPRIAVHHKQRVHAQHHLQMSSGRRARPSLSAICRRVSRDIRATSEQHEFVAEIKGKLRVLVLTREDVRKVISSAKDAASLFIGSLVGGYE